MLRTVIAIGAFTKVHHDKPYPNTTFRWFYDGTIEYLHGKHIVLFVFAMVACVFLILYAFTLTFIPILDVCSEKLTILKWLNQKVTLLKPINDAYYAPYKGKWKIWLGARLWLVVLLYSLGPFLGSQNPRLLLLIHGILVIMFVVIQACILPFEEKLRQESGKKNCHKTSMCKYNLLDLFYMLNYSTLALTVSYLLEGYDANIIPRRVVVGVLVVMSLFVSIVFCIAGVSFKKCKTGGQRCSENAHLDQNVAMYPSNEDGQHNITALTAACSANFSFDDRLREPLLDDRSECSN